MPVYVYQILNADGSAGGSFEIEQPANAPALTAHPLTGAPVQRVIQTAHIAGTHNERLTREKLNSASELSRLGFTRYERDNSTGDYHKTAGNDPDAPPTFSTTAIARVAAAQTAATQTTAPQNDHAHAHPHGCTCGHCHNH